MNYNNLMKSFKIQLLVLVVFLSLFSLFLSDANPSTFDAKFGLEFVGGVRIPITLEKSVDANTMDSIVETLKNRISSFGLSQAVIRPIGDKEVLVEIPRADESSIASVKKILQDQGKFEAIIDGKQAVNGENVIAVGGPNGEQTPSTTRTNQWSLSFTVTKGGADLFSQAARGKARYPVYMFLDRPENTAIVLSRSELGTATQKQLTDALLKEGDDIALVFIDELNNSATTSQLSSKSKILISEPTLKLVEQKLTSLGFSTAENATKKIVQKSQTDIIPDVQQGEINEWKAIGLLSAPLLSEGLASGSSSQFYSITGSAAGATQQEQEEFALMQIKQLKSVISGGKLPVSALVGSSYSIEPSLGKEFLNYSVIATILGIIIVALLVILRYREIMLSIPIVVINIFEILILTAIIGKIGTIDLGAMAGIISLIGTGVDDQLIVTDEVLRGRNKTDADDKSSYGMKEKIGRAFSIIFTTAGVAIVAMMPLLLSGIVEISGFAFSAIIGVLIGIFITRPAFAVILEE
ncbi:MAG: hypothetical protein V1644_00805, partial [Candidatus Micrarchaeota archaeon]